MAVQKMKKICICAGKQDRKAILETLQRMGTVEICEEEMQEAGNGLGRMDVSEMLAGLEETAGIIRRALETLDRMEPEKRSLFSALEGKKLFVRDIYKKGEACGEEACGWAEKILELAGEMERLETENTGIAEQIRELEPWKALDLPLDFPGTGQMAFLAGSITGAEMPHFDGESGVEAEILDRSGGRTCLGILCERTAEEQVREVLGKQGFVPAPRIGGGTPGEVIRGLDARARKNRDRILGCRQEIGRMRVKRSELEQIEDYCRVRAQKYRVLGELWQSRTAFFLEGYVPGAVSETVREKIQKRFAAVVEIRDPDPREEAPVLLGNGWITESVQGVLEAFGLPRKGETDPTPVMWIFYVFFFGMMLADAAYGFLVAVFCGGLLFRFRRMSPVWRRSVKLFFWCGISTMIWGVLFGSYFGDALDVAAEAFWGVRLPEGKSLLPAVWFAPIQDPMKMLLFAMLFGLIHLLTGLGIRGYRCLREKRYEDFFCQTVLWYVLLAGLLLLLLPGEIFRSVAGIQVKIPPVLEAAGKVLTVAGALGIVLFAGRRAKNPALRLALGAYELYGVTGWLGDVLSYSRLLALGLATGVIASVINQMGVMLGPVGFLVVFLVGHLLNLAINLLGAYVHTCRLQYVEFFGKFYEGGGKPFRPFGLETKYVEIKEEL